eukprot:EG_transcript_1804
MAKRLQWVPAPRRYRAELAQRRDAPAAPDHPLHGALDGEARAEPRSNGAPAAAPADADVAEEELADPLLDDPLNPRPLGVRQTAFNTLGQANRGRTETARLKRKVDDALDWELLRRETLATYTTHKNIPVVSKIVDDVEREPEVVTLTERARRRLEGLEEEDEEAKGTKKNMTQRELVAHLESLADELESAWGKGEKVKSLRIVIQSCKLLISCPVPQAYPSLFMLVSKVLDTFGRLVFDRIKRRAQFDERTSRPIQTLPADFRAEDIPDEAKEMCKNWFFKVAAIRELIPRVYVELCLWGCHRFLVEDRRVYTDMMGRFVAQMRGMGDPLVANYARVYLLHKAAEIFNGDIPVEHRVQCFEDWSFTRRQWQGPHFQQYLETSGQTMAEYVRLYAPSLGWVLSWLAVGADEGRFEATLALAQQGGHLLVLQQLIAAFRPTLIARHAPRLVQSIKALSGPPAQRLPCYAALGVQLAREPPAPKLRLHVLNEVWADVAEVQDPECYLPVAHAWLEFVARHLSHRETSILVSDIMAHLGPDAFTAGLEGHVQGLLGVLLEHVPDFHALLSLDPLLPLIDLLKPDSKVDVCKSLLTSFTQLGPTVTDPVLVHALLDLCRTLHDSLTEFSVEDDRRQFAQLIGCVLPKVSFGADLDAHLAFFVECRRSFSKLDAVIEACVMGVLRLVSRSLRLNPVRQHSKRAAAFVKACLAYCHITVPALADPFQRLRLLLLAAMVAFGAGFAQQADTLLHTVLALLRDVPPFLPAVPGTLTALQSTEAPLGDFLHTLLAALVAVPGRPEEGPLSWVAEVVAVVQAHPWDAASPVRGQVAVAALRALSALAQEELPYHFGAGGVPSNDELHAGSDTYRPAVEALATDLLDALLTDIAALADGDRAAAQRAAELAADLLATAVAFAEPTDKLRSLAGKLWAVAAKQPGPPPRQLALIRTRVGCTPAWASLAERLT